ncbi:hypothetical protein Tco_1532082 [Tanacetum coccineum]
MYSYAIRLKFKAPNYAMDYEALSTGLSASANQGVKDLHVFIDSLTLLAQIPNHTSPKNLEPKSRCVNRVGDYKVRIPQPGSIGRLVPSCFVIFDLELLSLSFDFVFLSEIFKSLSFRLDRLCHLAILCLDQHAHTLHHLESLLTISIDRLNIFEGRSCISEFVRKSLSLILELS